MVALPPTEPLAGTFLSVVALSPDGIHLAYVATRGGNHQLYLRAMDVLEARPIPGTEGASIPFFSPDGQWLGFFANGKLKKVSMSGGLPLTLCDAPSPFGATWGPDDTIVFVPNFRGGLWQVSAAGGTPQELTTLKDGAIAHLWPEFLPGAKAVLFTVATDEDNADDWQIAAHFLEEGEPRVLIEDGTFGRYVPTGHLVYYRSGTMLAVPFDPAQLEVMGTSAPVVEGIRSEPVGGGTSGVGHFSFSSRGSLVYLPDPAQGQPERTLVWVDRKGAVQPLAAPLQPYDDPSLSPDGQKVAVEVRSDVWVYDIARNTFTPLNFEGNNGYPIWRPDGKRLAFLFGKEGIENLFWKPADGSSGEERLTTSEYAQNPESWSPDGEVLAFTESHPTTGEDIWVLSLEGERKPQPWLQTRFNESNAQVSPDGRWLAYESNESGRNEVYVQPFPGPGGKRQVSTPRRHRAEVGTQRAGAVLSQWQQDDAGRRNDNAHLHCQQPEAAI